MSGCTTCGGFGDHHDPVAHELDRWWLCAHEDPCVHPGEDLLWDHCTGCRAWAGEPCNCADGAR